MKASAYSQGEAGGQMIATPRWFIREYQGRNGFTFDLDVCAVRGTNVCKKYITPRQDAFRTAWDCTHAFMNPPWGDPLPWVRRAIDELARLSCESVTMLCASKVETGWFRLAAANAITVEHIFPRLNYFGSTEKNPTRRLLSGINVGSSVITLTPESVVMHHSHTTRYPEYRRPEWAKR